MRGILAVLLLLVAGLVQADVLIVTKQGESLWATTAKKDGETVTYTLRDDGKEVTRPATELDGVLPVVKRGTSYEPDEIQKYIERIQKVRAKHPKLLKQLNGILQEWENLAKPDPEMEANIGKLSDEFQKGTKDTRAYRRLNVELGMLGYKDMQGKYAARIKTILADARQTYVSTNMVRIQALAASGKTDVDTFRKIKALGNDVLQAADGAVQTTLKALMEKSAAACLEAGLRDAPKVFAAGKSLDAYMESSRLLYALKHDVAATEETEQRVTKAIDQLIEQATAAIKTHNFSYQGFPLSQEDIRQFNAAGERASRVSFADVESEEACLMQPTRAPGALRLGQSFSVPVKLMFNQAQPADRVFGFIVLMNQEGGGIHRHTLKLPALAIKNAQAAATVLEDFAAVDKTFKLGAGDKLGNSYYFCCFAYRASEDNGNGEEDWRALSPFCSWRID